MTIEIQIQRFELATELWDVAEPFLMRNEAHHNLILGLIYRLARTPDFYASKPYFATAVRDGETVAAAVITPSYPLVLSLCDDREAIERLAADAHDFSPDTAGVNSPLPGVRRFAEAWHDLTGEASEVGLAERVYKLERVMPPAAIPGEAKRAADSDVELLISWRMAFTREVTPWEEAPRESVEAAIQRVLQAPSEQAGRFVWQVDGQPVCMVGYGSPTPNSLRIAPVYTPPQHRRHGYASACTAAACPTSSIAASRSLPCSPTWRTRPRTTSIRRLALSRSATRDDQVRRTLAIEETGGDGSTGLLAGGRVPSKRTLGSALCRAVVGSLNGCEMRVVPIWPSLLEGA